jgi:hypothetical protein
MAKRRHDRRDGKCDDDKPMRKSLGRLFRNKSATPKAPSMTGQCTMQRHFVKELYDELARSDSHEIVCNIAAWLNEDGAGKEYVTVELSPKASSAGYNTNR